MRESIRLLLLSCLALNTDCLVKYKSQKHTHKQKKKKNKSGMQGSKLAGYQARVQPIYNVKIR